MLQLSNIENYNWLIACSGGPDSMALLDMMYKKGLNIGVACVNYRKRTSAIRDVNIVKSYCDKYHLPFYLLDKEYEYSGNFQSFARNYRYDFFKKICDEFNYDGIMVAHHLDDLLETYIMQKDKKLDVDYYGLRDFIVINGLNVYRPLLSFEKKQLQTYCDINNISYGIDESNLSDDYSRNKVRHHIIDKMSKDDKLKMLEEITNINHNISNYHDKLFSIVSDNGFYLSDFNKYSDEDKLAFLRVFLNRKINTHVSNKYLLDVLKQLSNAKNFISNINDYYFVRSYDHCYVIKEIPKDYCYVVDHIEEMETKYFKIKTTGDNLHGVSVSKDDFPLVIRNAKDSDHIILRYGTKKLSRFFIDRKIDIIERKRWPVVENRHHNIILVPEIGCDIAHYTTKHNFFVIKW